MCDVPGLRIHTRAELLRTHTPRRIADSLARGRITRVRRGVYAEASACSSVIAAARRGGSLACISAARHLGLWTLSEPELHVWVQASRHQYAEAGQPCRVHWDPGPSSAAFSPPSIVQVLRQIASCRSPEEFFVVLESARNRQLIDRIELDRLRQQVPPWAADLIDFSRNDAQSGLESLVRLRLRRFGLSVRSQVRVFGVGIVDLLIGDILIVETDGRLNHDGPSMRHKDLVRDANAALWGYRTLRFDYDLILNDWDLVERAILAALSS